MRNRVAHGYDEIDWEVVWNASVDDIPRLIARLEPLLPKVNGWEPLDTGA